MSPGFRSLNGDNNLKLQDDRRPSVASTTSFSSTNSKRSAVSAKYKKKLQGFFGEDYEKMGERQNSDGSLQNSIPASAHASFMERKGSTPGYRPSSPASSRPKTPQASSEVTPWVFQDSAVSAAESKWYKRVYKLLRIWKNERSRREAGLVFRSFLSRQKRETVHSHLDANVFNRTYRIHQS